MKTKKQNLCMFCMKPHRTRKPKICQAKADIMRAYIKAGAQMWQFLQAVHTGQLSLESEAKKLVRQRRKAGV